MSDRYYSLDVLKGFGIIVMVTLHGIMQQVAQFDPSVFIPALTSQNPVIFVLLVPLVILGTMGATFTFVTCIITTTQLWHLWESKTNHKKIIVFLLSRVFIGFFILLSWRISSILIGFLTQRPLDEYLQTIFWDQLVIYHSETLDSIVWVGVISPVIFYLLLLIFGTKKPWLIIGLCLFLAFLSFALSPLVISFGESLIGPIRSHHYYLLEFVLSKIIYGRFKIAQTIAFGFFGILFGILLVTKQSFKIVARVSFGIAGGCFITFISWFTISSEFMQSFASEDVPLPVLMLATSGIFCLVLYFLKQQQFCASEEIRLRHARRSTWMRRYGLVSLTAFAWGTAYADLIFALFTPFWGPTIDRTGGQPVLLWNVVQVFTFVIALFLAWELLLRLWEKIRYVMSLEWWIHIILNLLYRKKSLYDPKQIIYEPNQTFPSDTKITVKE